jgi:excisionase family DNA binding protein
MKDLKERFKNLPDPLSVKEVSGFLRCHENTVVRWISSGKLEAYQPAGKGGSIRIEKSALAHKIFKDGMNG